MAALLGAPLGCSSFSGCRVPHGSASTACSSGRTSRSRVKCQAAFGAPKPPGQRVREVSPSKVQALAAAERELLLPGAPPRQVTHGSSNILEVRRSELEARRSELERLLSREAELAQEFAQRQQQDSQPAAAQQQSSAAASLPARAQQSRQAPRRQQRQQALVPSTRAARSRLATAAAPSSHTAVAAPRPLASSRRPAASSAALTSWLLDCRSRRERRAEQPLAAAPRRTRSHSRGHPGAAAGSVTASCAASLDLAALHGVSEETKQDMQVMLMPS
jgi:hypothetical protein